MLGFVSRLDKRTLSVVVYRKSLEGSEVQLLVNGTVQQSRYIGPNSGSPEDDLVEIHFELPAGDVSLLCIKDPVSDAALPPGEFLHSSSGPPLVPPTSLAGIDYIVRSTLSKAAPLSALQHHAATVMSWADIAFDRVLAGRRHDQRRLAELRAHLSNESGFGGHLTRLMALVAEQFAPLRLPECSNPAVSIVIPVHNNFRLTYDCISSICARRTIASFEIIIVDDFSDDETLLAPLVFQGAVGVLRNHRNLGFVKSCNAGATRARGEFILFLNNDTIVRDDWLDELLLTFEKKKDAGIVGSRLVYSDGRLQDCGGLVWRDGSAWNWGHDKDPEDPRFQFLRKTDYVSGAALMLRTSLFSALEGFDESFCPAYYEDTDLCFKVWQCGQSVYVQPASTIVHLEGQSNGIDLSSGIKSHQAVNRFKFEKKWRDTIGAYSPNGERPLKSIYKRYKGLVLFIDDTVLTPDRDAGSNAAKEHILSLMRLGFHVLFMPADNMAVIQPYTKELEKIGVEMIVHPHFNTPEDWIDKTDLHIDIVYIHRFSNAKRLMSVFVGRMPRAAIVYNVADVHSLREQRGAQLGLGTETSATVDADEELSLIASADATIVHSSYEEDYIKSHRPGARVQVVPWVVRAPNEIVPFVERVHIGFIGGFAHPPNVDAVIWLARHVMPLLPEICCLVAGSNMPPQLLKFESSNLKMIGFVSDLDDFLSGIRVSVAPLRYGAGLKGKVLSSFSQGTPAVMTSIAAEGFRLGSGLARNVQNDPAKFAERVRTLYEDREAWEAACWSCVDLVDEDFSQEAVDGKMSEALLLAEGRARRRISGAE